MAAPGDEGCGGGKPPPYDGAGRCPHRPGKNGLCQRADVVIGPYGGTVGADEFCTLHSTFYILRYAFAFRFGVT